MAYNVTSGSGAPQTQAQIHSELQMQLIELKPKTSNNVIKCLGLEMNNDVLFYGNERHPVHPPPQPHHHPRTEKKEIPKFSLAERNGIFHSTEPVMSKWRDNNFLLTCS